MNDHEETPKAKKQRISGIRISKHADGIGAALVRSFAPPIVVMQSNAEALKACGFVYTPTRVTLRGTELAVSANPYKVNWEIYYIHDESGVYEIASARDLDAPEPVTEDEDAETDLNNEWLDEALSGKAVVNEPIVELPPVDNRSDAQRAQDAAATWAAATKAADGLTNSEIKTALGVEGLGSFGDWLDDATIARANAAIEAYKNRVDGVAIAEVVDEPATAPVIELATPTDGVQKALTVVNERVQPNRYWLQSAAWQPDPLTLSKFAAESGLYPNIKSQAQAFVSIMKGVELGISPMTALSSIHVIDGKPSISGELMLGLLQKEGVRVEFIERTSERCTLRMTRPDNGLGVTVTFTIEDAKKAQLTGKQNWVKYARAMLTWRAVAEAARIVAADILTFGGIPNYVTEELAPDMAVAA